MRNGNKFFVFGSIFILTGMLLFVYNITEDLKVGENTGLILSKLLDEMEEVDQKDHDSYKSNIADPNMEMPTKLIDGMEYIGYILIPALDLKLPVLNKRSYENIRISPARYRGSIYLNNMIILAHNYDNHFGKLHRMKIGDAVKFVDIDDNIFEYAVEKKEELSSADVSKMVSDRWDLTLFTCTLEGEARITIRCMKKNNNQDIIRSLKDNL